VDRLAGRVHFQSGDQIELAGSLVAVSVLRVSAMRTSRRMTSDRLRNL
jgi:hypothetical protein